jgi:transposase-like protein
MSRALEKGCVINSEDERYLQLIMDLRWPAGRKKCSRCRSKSTYRKVLKRSAYACQNCGQQIYPLTGTIFSRSTTSLSLWFKACRQFSSDPLLPATFLERELEVTYKTAWRMITRIHSILSLRRYIDIGESPAQLDRSIAREIVKQADRKRRVPARSRIKQRKRPVAEPIIKTGTSSSAIRPRGAIRRRLKRRLIDPESVMKHASRGWSVSDIANCLGCERHALLRYYKKEILQGRLEGSVSGRRNRRRYRLSSTTPREVTNAETPMGQNAAFDIGSVITQSRPIDMEALVNQWEPINLDSLRGNNSPSADIEGKDAKVPDKTDS